MFTTAHLAGIWAGDGMMRHMPLDDPHFGVIITIRGILHLGIIITHTTTHTILAGDIEGTTGIVGGIRTRIGTGGIPIGMFIAMHLFTIG